MVLTSVFKTIMHHARMCGSRSQKSGSREVGFNKGEESVDIADRRESCQNARDERLWKLILSPEFGTESS